MDRVPIRTIRALTNPTNVVHILRCADLSIANPALKRGDTLDSTDEALFQIFFKFRESPFSATPNLKTRRARIAHQIRANLPR